MYGLILMTVLMLTTGHIHSQQNMRTSLCHQMMERLQIVMPMSISPHHQMQMIIVEFHLYQQDLLQAEHTQIAMERLLMYGSMKIVKATLTTGHIHLLLSTQISQCQQMAEKQQLVLEILLHQVHQKLLTIAELSQMLFLKR